MPTFSSDLEKAIHASLALANSRRNEFTTLEHLLLALIDEPSASMALKACAVDIEELRTTLSDFVDNEILREMNESDESVPNSAYQRVVQRAAINVQTAGRTEVTGAGILMAIFAERESFAASFLSDRDVTRQDVLNFVEHGIAKVPALGRRSFAPEEFSTQASTDQKRKAASPPKSRKSRSRKAQKFVFLSYSRKDENLARAMRAMLFEKGFNIWWDQDISPGDSWRAAIKERLAGATCILTIWTKHSVLSEPVIEEASTAQQLKRLVHVRADDSELPYGFAETQYINLEDWDGTAAHPQIQRLAAALKAKLNPPSLRRVKAELLAASPIKAVARRGKLSLIDRPEHTPPPIWDPRELSDRVSALIVTVDSLCSMLQSRDVFQASPCALHCLNSVRAAAIANPLTWYALEDSRDLLARCAEDADLGWNVTVCDGIRLVKSRIEEIKPLLQPQQITRTQPNGPPPPPIANIEEGQVPEVLKLTEIIEDALTDETAHQVLNADLIAAAESAAEQVREAAVFDSLPTRRFSRLRRSLTKLAFIAGGVASAVATGIFSSMLSSREATTVLAERLQLLLDYLFRYFM